MAQYKPVHTPPCEDQPVRAALAQLAQNDESFNAYFLSANEFTASASASTLSPGSAATATCTFTPGAEFNEGAFAFVIGVPTGATGAAGSNGSDGSDGSDGAAGAPGSVWRDGSGAPSNGLGIDGDYYLNSSNGDVYQKASSSYAVVANIKGATGDTGATGPTGPDFYTPGDASSWDGSAPTTFTEALDRCAVLLKGVNGGTGP
jgi:hypothetical protein